DTLVVRVQLHPVHTGADGQLFVDFISDRRIDVDAFNAELLGVVASDPAVVVLGLEAERNTEAEPQVPAGVDLPGNISVGRHPQGAGVATVPANSRRASKPGASPIGKFERRLDGSRPGRYVDAGQPGHAGRIEKYRAGVVGNGR